MPLTNFYHSYSGNSIGRFLGYSSVRSVSDLDKSFRSTDGA